MVRQGKRLVIEFHQADNNRSGGVSVSHPPFGQSAVVSKQTPPGGGEDGEGAVVPTDITVVPD